MLGKVLGPELATTRENTFSRLSTHLIISYIPGSSEINRTRGQVSQPRVSRLEHPESRPKGRSLDHSNAPQTLLPGGGGPSFQVSPVLIFPSSKTSFTRLCFRCFSRTTDTLPLSERVF